MSGVDADEATRVGDGDVQYYPKEAITTTFLKIDHFNDKLSAIRKQLADRRHEELRPREPFNASKLSNNCEANVLVASDVLDQRYGDGNTGYDPIRLPVLPNATQPPRATVPMFDTHVLSMDALHARASAQSQYDAAWQNLQRAEQEAAATVQEADRLTEKARIAMVLYTQNEKSWNFDERARRYQQVMQAKKEADGARLKADDDRIAVQCLRAQLSDPYMQMRSQSNRSNRIPSQATLAPITTPLSTMSTDDAVLVWILASPLLTLPFTPRDATPGRVLAAEKELSTHVVYYAAASLASTSELDADDGANDKPPLDGWLSCSSHGVAPVPVITQLKSSLETWMVSGAGAGHVNGKFIFSGIHNGTRKFKSTSGVELFRKKLPKTSSIIQGLFDDADTDQDDKKFKQGDAVVAAPGNLLVPQQQLPSTLQTLEQNPHDFKSMEKIGAWMGADETRQKRRRLRDTEYQNKTERHDGDHVRVQETSSQRQDPNDVAPSRDGASAELCREWVLFMRCSRRVDQHEGMSDTPPRNIGLGCLKRHYYISHDEKETMVTWAQEQEAWLEKDVLSAIIKREANVEWVTRVCRECMSSFQENLADETHVLVNKILKELNTVRFLTVKVLEAIETWRAHARKRGFTRYEPAHDHAAAEEEADEATTASIERAPPLGWSASITVATGRKLFKGSKAFVSKFKRFCRPDDPHGQQERRLVYLGYFATRDEAEQAYDAFANAEARRLNTTVAHLPRRRSVFRSCGKHFAVESERLGPDYCIECKAKQLSTAATTDVTDANGTTNAASGDDWNPPFFYTPGQNYILKLASDLDFLDHVLPLKSRLDVTASSSLDRDAEDDDHHHIQLGQFPLLGNVFLLPKTPIEDPSLAFFASLHASGGSIPQLRGVPSSSNNNNNQEEQDDELLDEALDVERVLRAQQIFLQEMLIYHPDLFANQSTTATTTSNQSSNHQQSLRSRLATNPHSERRIVMALYWDRCAALRIQQDRAPLPFRQPGVWCRPDAGEWASLLVRGKHQQHFLFDLRLAKAGKEMHARRQRALKTIRKLLKTPLYFIPSRDVIVHVIQEGELVKGDVVMLEVKSAYKFLDKYDCWCVKSVVAQRWYRGIRGRRRARARRRALTISCLSRRRYMDSVSRVAIQFYEQLVIPTAVRSTIKKLQRPVYTQSVDMDGELVLVSVHASQSSTTATPVAKSQRVLRGTCCPSCARRFRVAAQFHAETKSFRVASTAVCTCQLNNPVASAWESWIVRAYNPHSNCVYRLSIQHSLLMQLLEATAIHQSSHQQRRQHTLQMKWNPVTECVALRQSVRDATNFANYVESLACSASQDATNWRILSDEATQRRKTAEIELERARDRVVELAKRFDIAIGDARRAMDFASRPFHDAQAWDPLENANDWRLLVQKRHTQKELAAAVDVAEDCRVELFQATSSERFLRVQSTEARAAYESHWRKVASQWQSHVATLAMELETKVAIATRAMQWLCSQQLTLRDAFLVPTRRSLILAPAVWQRTDVAMARMLMIAIPGLERARNTVRRRVLRLSDRSIDVSKRRYQRLIVDVSTWTTCKVEHHSNHDKRNVWMTAYDPETTRVQRVYLDWELVQLLATASVVRPSGPRQSSRSRWLRIADKLLSLCMLDRFTGEFTLEKLQFYHHLRLLRPHFLASKWFQDVKCGRKCGDGDEIYRQSALIDGKLCVVTVFENWGDLVLRVYLTSSATGYRLRLGLNEIITLLSRKPLALHLWICCVKSNQYVPSIITLLLKFVVFIRSDNDGELELSVVQDRPLLPASQTTLLKRIFQATTIQHRRVLVSYRDTTSGDLDVGVYDVTHNRNYKLRLEWETIRRALKAKDHNHDQTTQVTTRRRTNLTLTRNRRELCEWITSRLRFQSLLEHPDVLASSSSPLVAGLQLRTTLALFNDWITSGSVRNPLQIIGPSQIDEYAAAADAMVFQGLVYEQLAFVPHGGRSIACRDDKTFLETRDFSTSSQELRQKHLKVDLYSKAHQIYARVRHELEQETLARQERDAQQCMESEDVLAMRLEILDKCATLMCELVQCSDTLVSLGQCITDRNEKWRLLSTELFHRVAARTPPDTSETEKKQKKKPAVRKKPKDAVEKPTSHTVDVRRAIVQVLASVRSHESVTFAVLMRQDYGLCGTLSTVAAQIATIGAEISDRVYPQVEVFSATTREAIEVEAVSLSSLVAIRSQCSRFFTSLDPADLSNVAPRAADLDRNYASTTTNPDDAASIEEDRHAILAASEVAPMATAFVIPPVRPIEEAAVDSTLLSTGSFSVVMAALSRALLPLFPRGATGNRRSVTVALRVKRVPYGLIVLLQPEPGRHTPQWNARASALAMEPVIGAAVFLPRLEEMDVVRLHACESLFQSLAPHDDHTSAQNKPRPSSGAIGIAAAAKRRVTRPRAKQLLPWKQFSVERMQTTRRLRQQRARAGLLLRDLERDHERDSATLATYEISSRRLEWVAGGSDRVSADAASLACLVESLRLQPVAHDSGSGGGGGGGGGRGWSLTLESEHRMERLFQTDTQLTRRISCDMPTSELQLQHIRVDADDWCNPRRLLFSCRELQSRQQYVVDCSYAQLQRLALKDDGLFWPRQQLSVHQWRKLAQAAAQKLVFKYQNGVLSLAIDMSDVDALKSESSLESASPCTEIEICSSADATEVVLPPRVEATTNAQFELLEASRSMRARRFMKLQVAVRHAAVTRQMDQMRSAMVSRRLPLEWLRMTQEDWAAQENRGLLTIDEKELKKLKQAFARVSQRRQSLSTSAVATASTGNGTTPQETCTREAIAFLLEIEREMGTQVKAKAKDSASGKSNDAEPEDEAASFLTRVQRTTWWKDKHPEGGEEEEERWTLDICDVAEYWRRRHHH